MTTYSLGTGLAAGAAVVGSSFLAGAINSISSISVPGLLSTAPGSVPAQALAQQWHGIYKIGKAQAPVFAAVALLGWAYLAYDRYAAGDHPEWKGMLAAGVLTVCIVPFTLIVMSPTNNALIAAAEVAAEDAAGGLAAELDVRRLIARWRGLNAVRSIIPLTGAIVGVWSILFSK